MSKRDFFKIVIKLFGLYSLINIFFQFTPSLLNMGRAGFVDVKSIIWMFIYFGIIILFYVFFLIKTDKVVDVLNLDKGFDDDQIILGNFKSINLISFATILIGGFLIVEHFPNFIHNSYLIFKDKVELKGIESVVNPFDSKYYYSGLSISAMNLVIGFLLLTNYSNVANWLNNLNKKNKKTNFKENN